MAYLWEIRKSAIAGIYLRLFSLILLGYALGGKGFAYMGIPPIYVGEIMLFLGTLMLFGAFEKMTLKTTVIQLLIIFMVWGVLNTIPYINSYGIDSLRDAVIWGYGLYALIVSNFLIKANEISLIRTWYENFSRIFLLLIIPILLITRNYGNILPTWPWSEGIPILDSKGGDVAVHLTGIAAFSLLGLSKKGLTHPQWILFWVITAGIVASTGRAALLTIIIPLITLIVIRIHAPWHRYFFIALFCLLLLGISDLKFDMGYEGRPLSLDTFVDSIVSIFSKAEINSFTGTKEWRLLWWNEIFNYTFHGEYFWTGKGFGINLATDDGFQVLDQDLLRSPHNGHLTILARIGVPGILIWTILQLSFMISLLYAFLRALKFGMLEQASLSLWILIYWMAFMINATFDVALEGPMMGIWYWSLVGLGVAQVVNTQLLMTKANIYYA